MIEPIANILMQNCQISKKERLIIGVSGGPDSLFLLHALYRGGFNLVAAHVNHQLRPEADQDALYVKQFAQQLGIEHVSAEVDVLAYASEHKVAIEEAARRLRYEYLFHQAERMDARAVVVGHTADDQAETILMHLLRGSGLSGLCGMQYRSLPTAWSELIPLVRPLLSTWRVDILRYLEENQITPAFDESNLDTKFLRNRVRHQLLPTLEAYAPNIRRNLVQLGQIARDDYDLIQESVEQAWDACLARQAEESLAFHRNEFEHQPPAIQRYLLRRAIDRFIPGLIDVEYEIIENGRLFIASEKQYGRMDLLAGIRLVREGRTFWVTAEESLPASEYPQVDESGAIALLIPGRLYLGNGWILEAETVSDIHEAIHQDGANLDRYQAWLDIGMVEPPLIVRARTSGDRIQPAGMHGHSMKISDLMINQKIPARARSHWPLVCSGAEVLWVPGYRLSDKVVARQSSTAVVHLRLFRDLSP